MSIIGECGIKIQKFGTLEVCQEDHFFTMQRPQVNTYKASTVRVKKNEEQ